MLAGFCNSVATQAFSAIGPGTKNLYGVSELEVNIVTMCFSIMYPFVLFPSNYIIEKFGLKVGTLTGNLCLKIG
jgi:fucose permease